LTAITRVLIFPIFILFFSLTACLFRSYCIHCLPRIVHFCYLIKKKIWFLFVSEAMMTTMWNLVRWLVKTWITVHYGAIYTWSEPYNHTI
jgi:hypothetical protein